MKVLGQRLLVRLVDESRTTESGLILPYSNDDMSYLEGTVLQVGPNVNDVQVDDKVYFTKSDIIKVSQKDYVVPYDNVFLTR